MTIIARFLYLISGFEGKLFVCGGMSCIIKTILILNNSCGYGWVVGRMNVIRLCGQSGDELLLKDTTFITV